MNKEFLIGFVFLVATASVAFVTATVQNWNPFRKDFLVYVDFNRVNDLAPNHAVMYSGVQVGFVKEINLIYNDAQEKIRVTISLEREVPIPANAIITIQDRTIIGGKKISIRRPQDPLPPIKRNHIFVGLDPDPFFEEAGTTLKKIQDSFVEVKSLLTDIKEGKGTMGKLFTDPALYENFSETGENLKNITGKIDKGDGSLGKLVNEDELYDDAQTLLSKLNNIHFDIMADSYFYGEDNYSITEAGLQITTSPKKFYQAKASIYRISHDTNIATDRAIRRQDDSILFATVLIGRRFLEDNNLEVAGGLIDGELGVRSRLGFTLANKDKFYLQLEGRNRIRDKDIRENSDIFIARTLMQYERSWKNFPTLRVTLGAYNVLDDVQGFFGLGFQFRDDDIKYLASALGGAS